MIREEAERRVMQAANRDAEVHQHYLPGEALTDAWAKKQWAMVLNEQDMVDTALVLGGSAYPLYLETLRNTVRVISKLVEIRIERWIDLAVPDDERRPLTVDEVNSFNAKLPGPRNKVELIKAGGAEVVSNYTQKWK